MADMTDQPFCLVCKKFGDPIIFREMVSSEAIVRENEKTWKMVAIDERERPLIQQIFGNDPSTMAEAARLIVERVHPDGIDINMGCPVNKIVSNFDGSALIKDPARSAEIVRAVKAAVTIPVSVKTRLGWSRKDECVSFVQTLADAGADLITIHGRTKEQGYSGIADWEAVGVARRAIPHIPFLVNGDIVDTSSAQHALAITGADGVMIGRGALGNPWIFNTIRSPSPSEGEGLGVRWFGVPPATERIATVLEHARLQCERYGEESGMRKLRKHLPFYFKGEAQWKELRMNLVRVSTFLELEQLLKATL